MRDTIGRPPRRPRYRLPEVSAGSVERLAICVLIVLLAGALVCCAPLVQSGIVATLVSVPLAGALLWLAFDLGMDA